MNDSSFDRHPEHPPPWATKKPQEGLRDLSEAKIVSTAPDVCLTPVGNSVVPIPYPIVAYCGDDASYTPTVKFTSNKAMVMASNTTKCVGDAAGSKKGVKSGTIEDICEPVGHAAKVRAEGSEVIRHLDQFKMNKGNTVGEAIFARSLALPPPATDTDPIPGSLQLAAMSTSSAAAPVPAPAPAPAPTPRPGGTVIRPDPPQWRRPPPTQPAPRGAPLTRFGRFAARIGLPLALLYPSPLGDGTLPLWFHDLDSLDPSRRRAAEEAQRRYIEDPDLRYDLEDWFAEEVAPQTDTAPQLQEEDDEQRQEQPLPQSDTVRVDEDEGSQRTCKVGPYEEIEPVCNGEAHHIVPDFVYRLETRPTTAAARASTADRIPSAPTFNQGMSICLTPAQHESGRDGLHGQLGASLRARGATSPVPGTAPMVDVLADSVAAIQGIPDLPEECKALASAMVTGQVVSGPGLTAPGRTQQSPRPAGMAREVLTRGYYE